MQQAVDTALTDTDIELLRWLRNNHDSIVTVFGLEQRMSLKDFGSFMGSQGLSLTEAELMSLSKLLNVDGDGPIMRKELEAIVKAGSLKYLRGHQVANALVKIAAFVFVALPIVCCTLAEIFGAILSVAEGWDLKECFYVVLMELSGTNIDLHTLCGETAAVAASCAQSTVGEAANPACNAVTALEDSTACQATGTSGACIYTQAVAAEAEECAEHPEGPAGKIVAALSAYVKQHLDKTPRVVVIDSSRQKTAGYKNSYHILLHDIGGFRAAATGTDGDMNSLTTPDTSFRQPATFDAASAVMYSFPAISGFGVAELILAAIVWCKASPCFAAVEAIVAAAAFAATAGD